MKAKLYFLLVLCTMKYNLLIISVLLLILFSSCASTGSSEGQFEVPSIKVALNNTQTLRLSDCFEEVSYIPLETSDDFLLGYIGKMLIEGNSIYFLSSKSVYSFDLNSGKGKMNLSKLGNGPGEYKSLFDFVIDKNAGNIELLDNNDKKIFVYDLKGNFQNSLSLPFMPFAFFKKTSSLYSFYNNNLKSEISSSKIVDYDVELQNKCNEYFPIDEKMAEYFFLGDEKVFNQSSKGFYCHISPIDTIYKYDEEKGFVPAFHLDFTDNAAPSAFYEKRYRDIMEFSEAANKNGYIYALSNFAVNGDDDVIFSYRLGKTFYWTLRLGMKSECTINALIDDFHFSEALPLSYQNSSYWLDDDYLYFLMTGEQFIHLCENGVKNDAMMALLRNADITDQSNPIVVKCKLKKN